MSLFKTFTLLGGSFTGLVTSVLYKRTALFCKICFYTDGMSDQHLVLLAAVTSKYLASYVY